MSTTSSQLSPSTYDPIAEMYHALWADWYFSSAVPALERLFFSHVSTGQRVLDVCCGSGHVTKELVRRGYNVTGVDASAGLIAIARREMPEVDWRVGDVRQLGIHGGYDAALCTFDSLNHLTDPSDLVLAFRSVHGALEPGGWFCFDMNLDEAYQVDKQQWVVEVHDTRVSMIRGTYDAETREVETELRWFIREPDCDLWKQQSSRIQQRSYSQEEILRALSEAGFQKLEAVPGEEAGVTQGMGIGRLFVTAHREK